MAHPRCVFTSVGRVLTGPGRVLTELGAHPTAARWPRQSYVLAGPSELPPPAHGGWSRGHGRHTAARPRHAR